MRRLPKLIYILCGIGMCLGDAMHHASNVKAEDSITPLLPEMIFITGGCF